MLLLVKSKVWSLCVKPLLVFGNGYSYRNFIVEMLFCNFPAKIEEHLFCHKILVIFFNCLLKKIDKHFLEHL